MRYLITLLSFLCSNLIIAQIDHYETLVYANDVWSYNSDNTQPPTNWNILGFDTTAWSQGSGGIGYGDDDDQTEIAATSSLFMRTTFELIDTSVVDQLVLHADYDDAFVAYINGTEVARKNIDVNPVLYNSQPIEQREATMYSGGSPESSFINKAVLASLLREGENVLAIQTLNFGGTNSSDMSALYWLSAGITDTSMQYGEVPSWFALGGFESTLPIFIINTAGQEIQDEPKITATLGIVWNEAGGMNSSTASPNHFDGHIGIEYRGNSSLAFFPKKNFGLETRTADGEELEVSLLGYPKEEDWVLHGPYSDKSLLRNMVMLDIGREVGPYASESKLVEVVLNGAYHGVYVFMERIKRDNDRVDIKKIEEEDVTGGYIIRVDHGESHWESSFGIQGNSGDKLGLQYYYPKRENITQPQATYIQSYLDSLERALVSSSGTFAGRHFSEYLDLESFADYFILSEFSHNIDAYRLSSYLYKDSDENDGKMKAGPIWDYNLALGNAEYCQGSNPNIWEYLGDCSYNNPFWWQKLMNNTEFRNLVKCKWYEQRDNVYNVERLHELIDNSTREMEGAIGRNFARWPVIGQYVWPNALVFGTYSEEVGFVKDYIKNRWDFIDNNIPGVCSTVSTSDAEKDSDLIVYPNPTQSQITVLYNSTIPTSASLYNLVGDQVINVSLSDYSTTIDVLGLPQGTYILKLIGIDGTQISTPTKVVKL